ncbi:MAG: YchF family ATPase [Proteobacteria bacterium]|nr:YchF family ATPase [Pseudomonadota bacterium]
MKLGIIGLAGSGKTTIFETLTGSFPETPNKSENRIGTVTVPDDRVGILSDMYNPKKTIYAQVEYFLPGKLDQRKQAIWNQVRDCDALIHVIRNFPDFAGETATVNSDFAALDQELMLADQVVVEKRLETLDTEKQRGKKYNEEEYTLLQECLVCLENETPLRKQAELAGNPVLKGFTFLSGKPMLVLFNNPDDNDDLPELGESIQKEDCLAIKGKLEHELAQMSEEEAADFLEEFQIKEVAMELVISRSYDLLGLASFFTVGEDEVRAWTIKKDTIAVDAADVIHSDIKKGFIRAEVLFYDDLMAAKTYAEARKAGTVRLEGKTYPVKDGDIINFRFNV